MPVVYAYLGLCVASSARGVWGTCSRTR